MADEQLEVVAGEQELAQLVDAGTVRAGLILPPTYAADLVGGRGAQAAFVLDGSDPSVAPTSAFNPPAAMWRHT